MKTYKYIYGPVNSWRLGSSLGIDALSQRHKVCTFDCVYCQVGRFNPIALKRRVCVLTKDIIAEIKSLPEIRLDYITFSGRGEPTLAKNLGTLIRSIKRIRKEKIAVLTNATLLGRKDVQQELSDVDLVEVKLDAPSDIILSKVNRPVESLNFNKLIKGIRSFKRQYKCEMILQVMFLKSNIGFAKAIADIARSIKPDQVHINTPLRPSGVKPVSKKDIEKVKIYFKGLKVSSVYDVKTKNKIRPISRQSTLKRRGKV